jgi:hypothetical protein
MPQDNGAGSLDDFDPALLASLELRQPGQAMDTMTPGEQAALVF